MMLESYRQWMQAREYSAGTMEKYSRDVARFFRETGAQDLPDKQTVTTWRDSLVARAIAWPASTPCWPP